VCGGNTCECFFGPPLPLVTANNPTCVLNQVTAVGGTANVDEGSGTIDFSLAEFVHLGITSLAPCPYCDADPTPGDGMRGGTCVGGVDDGLDCDAESGNSTFPAPGGGRASLDCFPDAAANISGSGLKIDVALKTGTSTLAANVPCSSADPAGAKCPCGVCSLDSQIACSSDEDCANAAAGTVRRQREHGAEQLQRRRVLAGRPQTRRVHQRAYRSVLRCAHACGWPRLDPLLEQRRLRGRRGGRGCRRLHARGNTPVLSGSDRRPGRSEPEGAVRRCRLLHSADELDGASMKSPVFPAPAACGYRACCSSSARAIPSAPYIPGVGGCPAAVEPPA
jgi:hypothetical protein